MNKDELLKQKEVLQAELNKLEELIKQEDEPAYYAPKMNEKYFYLDVIGTVESKTWQGTYFDRIMDYFSNCYETSSEARYAREIQRDLVRLQRLALTLNKGEEINWKYTQQTKYYLIYNHFSHYIEQCKRYTSQGGGIYCLNSEYLNEAIKLFGKERLREILTYQRY